MMGKRRRSQVFRAAGIAGFAMAILLCGVRALRAQEDIPTQVELHNQYAQQIQPLFKNYCIRCHDRDTTSTVRLDTIKPDIAPDNIDTWTRVKNMLSVGSMPPKDKRRPTPQELDLLLLWIDGSLKRYDADHKEKGGDTLIRRINNRAYANMIKTLLGVPAQGIEEFPEDGEVRGFDTVGASLYTTTYLYELYLKCARETLDMAISENEAPPEIKEYKHKHIPKGSSFDPALNALKGGIANLSNNPGRFETRSMAAITNELGLVVPASLQHLVNRNLISDTVAAHYGEKTIEDVAAKGIDWPSDASCVAELLAALELQMERIQTLEQYTSEFKPETVAGFDSNYVGNLNPGYYVISARLCNLNPAYPLPVGIVAGDQTVQTLMLDAPTTAPKTYAVKVFWNKRWDRVDAQSLIPYYGDFTMGGAERYYWSHITALYGRTFKQYLEAPQNQFYDGRRLWSNLPVSAVDTNVETKGAAPAPAPILGPVIFCSETSVRGPIYESWPPPATARIFMHGVKAPPTREYAEEIVKSFMKRAYAVRDCDAAIANPYVDMIMSHYESGKNFVDAVKFTLSIILSSPQFLYLNEDPRADAAKRKPLSAFELARRLAYFLWSDLPDDALLASAASGALLDAKELVAQTRRMLKDERSRAFREAFSSQWLKIDKLGLIAFSYDLFPGYDKFLMRSAKEESVAFFSELLEKNESVLNFIDSDFAMLNGRLAQHYGIPGITGDEFRRVALPPGSHRGGVLTQASVLMATSNGMVGSLVRRGAFVMERLLGVSPGTPPPNVPPFDKTKTLNEGGAPLTQLERLSMHRENINCARCHDKIDLLGVGLENFDALGAWNAKLKLLLPENDKKTHTRWQEHEADVHGAMLDKTPYNGSDELKQRLLEHKDQFVKCLAEYMLIYALGRDLELSDRPIVDKLCVDVAAGGYGLSTLVERVVLSDVFRNK